MCYTRLFSDLNSYLSLADAQFEHRAMLHDDPAQTGHIDYLKNLIWCNYCTLCTKGDGLPGQNHVEQGATSPCMVSLCLSITHSHGYALKLGSGWKLAAGSLEGVSASMAHTAMNPAGNHVIENH